MLATLCKVLFAALFMILLAASPGYAAGLDEANDLIGEANAVLLEKRSVEAESQVLLQQAYAIDPLGEHSADAVPMFLEAQGMLGDMIAQTQSVAALWAQVGALHVSDQSETYADQRYMIAQKYLDSIAVDGEILERSATWYDPEQRAQLSASEERKLLREVDDLVAQSYELQGEIAKMELASQQYYEENDLAHLGGGQRTWSTYIVALVAASVSALICGLVARRKNRNVVGWGVFGFLIPLAALIAILVVPRVDLEQRSSPLLNSRA